jgi:hypothetical protein
VFRHFLYLAARASYVLALAGSSIAMLILVEMPASVLARADEVIE